MIVHSCEGIMEFVDYFVPYNFMSILLINHRCSAMHFHRLFCTSHLGAPDNGRYELFKPNIHHRDNQETKTQNVLD